MLVNVKMPTIVSILTFMNMMISYSFELFVLNTLLPSQQFYSRVGTISCLPGLSQYQAMDKVSCSRTQRSDSDGLQTKI